MAQQSSSPVTHASVATYRHDHRRAVQKQARLTIENGPQQPQVVDFIDRQEKNRRGIRSIGGGTKRDTELVVARQIRPTFARLPAFINTSVAGSTP